MRIALSIAASKGWDVKTVDIKSAYLQGHEIDRDVFVKPPKTANTSKLWKLKKNVYGLNDSGRQWYIRLMQEIVKAGCVQSKFDLAVFTCMDVHNSLCGLLLIHVDDILLAGNKHFAKIESHIRNTFSVGDESDSKSFKYIGLQIEQAESEITLSQHLYCQDIREIDMSHMGSAKDTPLSVADVTLLRSLSGQLNWAATQSRPDIAFSNCMVSSRIKNATRESILKANKTVRSIHSSPVYLRFSKLNINEGLKIVAFSDASFANLPGEGSQGGYLIFLVDSYGLYSLIAWQSHRIQRVVNSTLSAETLAVVEARIMCVYLRSVLLENC